MSASRAHALFAIVIALCALHGIFASGFVPIVHLHLPGHAALAFAIYFAGLLLGQFAIYRLPALSRGRLALPAYEILFGASLLGMAASFGFLPYGIVVGRSIEGLAAGLGLPLMFAAVLRLPVLRSAGVRIALFQSIFALGFVAGPVTIAWLSGNVTIPRVLAICGGVFIACGLGFVAIVRERETRPPPEADVRPGAERGWFDTFYVLFLAKCFYGFVLPFVAGDLVARGSPLDVAQLMLLLAAAFIVGQVVAGPVARVVPRAPLEVGLPLLLLAALVAYGATGWPWAFVPASTIQAMLLFVGLLAVATRPAGAREFAFFGCLSDPGMLVGAAIAGAGKYGLFVLGGLCLVPLIRAIARAPAHTRAEATTPFVGPISLFKLLRKQAAPVHEPVDPGVDRREVAARLRFSFEAPVASAGKVIRLAFAGDLSPTPEPVELAPELEELLREHDLRLINLEAPQTAAVYDRLNRLTCFDLPDAHFARMVPAFGVFSIANNHALDRGGARFEETYRRLSASPVTVPVAADLVELDVRGVRLGLLARTFGTNLTWRSHPRLAVVKPEDVVGGTARGRRLLDEIRAHRARVDVLILSYHWGYESEFWPSSVQQACWRLVREAGVDLLFGHHSHIVQPFEVSADHRALCLYSCGNFVSRMPLEVYRQGAVFSVTLRHDTTGCRIERVETRHTLHEADRVGLLDPARSIVRRHWAEQATSPAR